MLGQVVKIKGTRVELTQCVFSTLSCIIIIIIPVLVMSGASLRSVKTQTYH